MANLAIKGHATRGEEVIEILKMLGGSGSSIEGKATACAYFINDAGTINFTHVNGLTENYRIFTIEEFLNEFPYKVGDKVRVPDFESEVRIDDMEWNGYEVQYNVFCDESEWYLAEDLNSYNSPYKEQETMDKANKAVFDVNAQCSDIMNHLIKEETMEEIKIDVPKGYEFAGVDDDKQQVVFTKIQSQYPKTYEECCKILNIPVNGDIVYAGNWVYGGEYLEKHLDKLRNFQKLLICRAAYWKIAGEKMGLEKHWSPSKDDNVYCIFRFKGEIVKDNFVFGDSLILEFPTEEMRDAFYENFKKLINEIKELL